jgi:hypothetical protein
MELAENMRLGRYSVVREGESAADGAGAALRRKSAACGIKDGRLGIC